MKKIAVINSGKKRSGKKVAVSRGNQQGLGETSGAAGHQVASNQRPDQKSDLEARPMAAKAGRSVRVVYLSGLSQPPIGGGAK